MSRRWGWLVVVGSLGLWACPGDDSDGDDGSSPTSGATGSPTTMPSSASNEDGPSPLTCEQLAGTCSCVSTCNEGQVAEPAGTCPQPPDESGACSQECCVPVSGTGASDSGTTAVPPGTDAGTTAADGGSSSSA